ncbi:MAG: class I SAM-dependent methyltransferase [Methanothrix sp.]|nr:class I SAM-dependent methyltransferase [Methanothrix sp.]
MPTSDAELKDAIREKWDESSLDYDSFHGHGIKSQEERDAWKSAFETVLPKGRLKILDVGCGTGEISLLLAEMGHQITGIDLSDKMLSIARSKAKASQLSAQFVKGDAESLKFDDESFDTVINRHLLWTLPHPDLALLEWKRILRKEGQVVLIDGLWMDGSLESRLRRLISDLCIIVLERQNPRKGWYSKKTEAKLPHPHGMDAQRAVDYLEEAGFKEIVKRSLDDIKDIQRRHMPFSQKVTYNTNYYMFCGRK